TFQRMGGRAFSNYRQAFQNHASQQLGEFFLFLDPSQLWLANLLICGVASLLTYLFAGLVPAVAVGAAAIAAPQFLVARVREHRLRRFDEQLPGLLLTLSGALRAGTSVQAAMRHIIPQMPAPLGQEFGLMLRQQRMGV